MDRVGLLFELRLIALTLDRTDNRIKLKTLNVELSSLGVSNFGSGIFATEIGSKWRIVLGDWFDLVIRLSSPCAHDCQYSVDVITMTQLFYIEVILLAVAAVIASSDIWYKSPLVG